MQITVANPAPVIPGTVTLTPAYDGFAIAFDRPTDPDFAGVKIYVDTTSGFTPGAGNQKYDGPHSKPIFIDGLAQSTTYYVKFVLYDIFGDSATSGQYSTTTLAVPDGDTVAPTIPNANAAPTVTSIIREAKLYATGELKIAWTGSTDNSGKLTYQVEFWTDPAKKTVVETHDLAYTVFPAQIGVQYSARVRAIDFTGNDSAFTPTATHTITADAAAPANVTGAALTALFSNVLVEWANPTDADFIETQIYRGTVSTFTPDDGINLVYSGRADTFVDTNVVNGTAYYYKFKTRDVQGNVSTASAASGPVTPFSISAANIGSFMADGAILTAKLGDLQITLAKLATNSVDTSKLVNDAVTNVKLATGAVEEAKIAANAVTAVKIADLAVTATKLGVAIGGDNLLSNSAAERATTGLTNKPDGWANYNNAGTPTSYTRPAGQRSGSFAGGLKLDSVTPAPTNWGWYFANGNVEGGITPGVLGQWQPNKTYVISFLAKKIGGASWTNVQYQWNTAPSTQVDISNPNLTTSYQRYARRVTWGAIVEGDGRVYLDSIFGQASAINDEFHVTDLMVQEGDTLTAWSPRANEILPSAITAVEIATDAITAPKIIAGAIVAGKIAAGAISTSNLFVSGVIDAAAIAANAITTDKLSANAVTAAKIAANTITANEIAALTITAAQIAASTITGAKIAAGTITASNIQALTITAAEIAAATITGAKIAAGTITAGNIAASTITADKLSVSQLSAIAADLGTITAGLVTGATVRTAASGAMVQLDSTNGIQAYDSGSVQRASIQTSGAGWFGGAAAFSWTAGGVVTIGQAVNLGGTLTATGIQSSAGNPKITIDSTNGIRAYNASGTLTASIKTDGSGFFGPSLERISWDTAGVVTVNVLKTATLGQRMEISAFDNEMHFYGSRGDVKTGTYSQTGTTITVTLAGHNLVTGQRVTLDFTTGTADDGSYAVTVTNSSTFTVTSPSSETTSGNVTMTSAIEELATIGIQPGDTDNVILMLGHQYSEQQALYARGITKYLLEALSDGADTDTAAIRGKTTAAGAGISGEGFRVGVEAAAGTDGFLKAGQVAGLVAPTVTPADTGRAHLAINAAGDYYVRGAGTSGSWKRLATGGATSDCKAWVNFDGVQKTGTYSQTGTTVTVTITAHGLTTGMKARLDFTTGTADDGSYPVTVTGANTFTVTSPSSETTSGNVTMQAYIRDSFNVSSITDNGTGDFTVNFASALASANYAVVGATTNGGGANGQTIGPAADTTTPTVSACRLFVHRSGVGIVDPSFACVGFFSADTAPAFSGYTDTYSSGSGNAIVPVGATQVVVTVDGKGGVGAAGTYTNGGGAGGGGARATRTITLTPADWGVALAYVIDGTSSRITSGVLTNHSFTSTNMVANVGGAASGTTGGAAGTATGGTTNTSGAAGANQAGGNGGSGGAAGSGAAGGAGGDDNFNTEDGGAGASPGAGGGGGNQGDSEPGVGFPPGAGGPGGSGRATFVWS